MTDESHKLSDLPPATRLLGRHLGADRWFYADAKDAHGEGVYSAGEVVAYTLREVQRAVAAERERWIGGVKVSIPTDTMEQEIAAHTRRAVAAERERIRDEFRKRHQEHQMSHNFYACLAREMDDGLL